MKRKKNIIFSIIVLLMILNAKGQQNTIIRKNLKSVIMEQYLTKVEIQEITFSPGQTAPKHIHPCSVVGYIKSGTVLFQTEGREPTILKEGEAFYEKKNECIIHFDNASNDKPLIFIAFYLKENCEENVKLVE